MDPASELEDAIATTNLLPGPASTQLAIFGAWRLRGAVGAVLGGVCFMMPSGRPLSADHRHCSGGA
jgi:chromate transporter